MTMFHELSKQYPEKYKIVSDKNDKFVEFSKLFDSSTIMREGVGKFLCFLSAQ